jgi:AcrR family transcriptional regulator
MNTPPAKSKWGDREARRADLLRAGRERLEREGYAALNIRAVAQDAGLSPGSMYTYFPSKEALFATLYAERLDRFLQDLRPLCASSGSLESLFAGFVGLYLPVYRVFGRELNLWSLVLRQQGEYPPELLLQLATQAQDIIGLMQAALLRLAPGEGIDAARLPDPALLMPLLWSIANGLADHFTGDRHLLSAQEPEQLARFGARLLFAGLRQLTTAGH